MDNAKDFIKKNQKLAIFALAIMVLSLPFVVNQILKRQDTRQRAQTAPAISFQISPASENFSVDDEFDVDLLMDTNSNDIGALEFTINYPSSTLELVSDTPLPAYTVADKQATAGSYKVTLLNITSTPVTGSNVKVVTLRFKALANGSATVKLDPQNLQVTASGSDQFVPVNNSDQIEGSYTVGQASGGATLSMTPDSGSHATGTNFNIQVRVNASEPVNAIELNIPYTSMLTVNSITKGEFDIVASETTTGGIINLAYGNITALSGDRLVATINFRANSAGIASLEFVNSQVLSSSSNQNILTGSTGGTYTVTGGVTPSVSPTATNTPTPTPTRTPTPTPTNTPTPTPTLIPNQASVNVSVTLPGIGLVVGDNTNPQSPNRSATIQIFNSQNQNISNVTGTITYTPATGRFQGTVSLGNEVSAGNYLINVKLPNTLAKRIPGIITVSTGTTTNTSPLTMVSGDLSNKNALDITDWTNMIACNRNESGCTAALRTAADLNDDGTVDVKDATILQRGFLIRQGD